MRNSRTPPVILIFLSKVIFEVSGLDFTLVRLLIRSIKIKLDQNTFAVNTKGLNPSLKSVYHPTRSLFYEDVHDYQRCLVPRGVTGPMNVSTIRTFP